MPPGAALCGSSPHPTRNLTCRRRGLGSQGWVSLHYSTCVASVSLPPIPNNILGSEEKPWLETEGERMCEKEKAMFPDVTGRFSNRNCQCYSESGGQEPGLLWCLKTEKPRFGTDPEAA